MDVELLARIQFAFTVAFHYIYPPLSIGIGLLMVIFESLYVKTKKEDEALMDSLNFGNSNKNGKKVKFEDTEIIDYLIISSARDTTYVDTTLSIKKEYKFNYFK